MGGGLSVILSWAHGQALRESILMEGDRLGGNRNTIPKSRGRMYSTANYSWRCESYPGQDKDDTRG